MGGSLFCLHHLPPCCQNLIEQGVQEFTKVILIPSPTFDECPRFLQVAEDPREGNSSPNFLLRRLL